jgi:protoporphyrinogen oxidase
MNQTQSVVIVGGGPAGLTAAYELVKLGFRPSVFEKDHIVGGIARTEEYKGYRYDIGGHRFYTKVAEVEQFWVEVLQEDFLKRPRLSRIYYDNKFYKYPLNIMNTLKNLGPIESLRIMFSYVKSQIMPIRNEETFEEWVTNRFGQRLFRTFFKTYTEKVWGIPCNEIRADWAAQRIKGLSLTVAVMNALFKVNNTKTLIEEFHYPRLGPGQMWEHCQQAVDNRGGKVELNTDVVKVRHDGKGRATGVVISQNGVEREVPCDQLLTSMPLAELITKLDPPPPAHVLDAAYGLNYRDFLLVGLIINQDKAFPDNWIYVHSPAVKVGRIQNFGNWSPDLVPDQSKTSLGMEYFCHEGDGLWNMSDAELVALATKEIGELGLADSASVEDGTVIRQQKAYPVYDGTYRQNLEVLKEYIQSFGNLQTIGRNGLHRYNNQDHSMLTAMLAVRNIMGEQHDLWEVNTERSYHEEFTKAEMKGREANGTAEDRADRVRQGRTVSTPRGADTIAGS